MQVEVLPSTWARPDEAGRALFRRAPRGCAELVRRLTLARRRMIPSVMSERAAERVCAELGLPGAITRFAGGSVPVFAVGDEHVVKLFPRAERAFFETERAALRRLEGALSIPTPRLLAAGEEGDWLFVAMTRLRGRLLVEAWPRIAPVERVRLMAELGAALRELHGLALSDLEPLAIDWPQFIANQRRGCRARQVDKGLGPPWLDAACDFIARFTPVDDGRRVLLHTEVMREHLLVTRRDDGWVLSGLFDFEPAMIGAPEYELASVGIFVTGGEPGLLPALVAAYGAHADDELPLRLMAYALLHRYSNLRWYLERLAPDRDDGDLAALATRWFGV